MTFTFSVTGTGRGNPTYKIPAGNVDYLRTHTDWVSDRDANTAIYLKSGVMILCTEYLDEVDLKLEAALCQAAASSDAGTEEDQEQEEE